MHACLYTCTEARKRLLQLVRAKERPYLGEGRKQRERERKTTHTQRNVKKGWTDR